MQLHFVTSSANLILKHCTTHSRLVLHVTSAPLPRERGRWSLSEGYKNRVVMERSVPRIAKDRTMARSYTTVVCVAGV